MGECSLDDAIAPTTQEMCVPYSVGRRGVRSARAWFCLPNIVYSAFLLGGVFCRLGGL